ncbi:rab-GTPase-TBC domain-containing protein [Spinellus fusiger]|nr:rab-GTPase-TBC domain-containing protein [Spinellus fusiger]
MTGLHPKHLCLISDIKTASLTCFSLMALFANVIDLKVHKHRLTPKLASCNFVASARSSQALAQSGHLAVSAPSQIMGRFQYLKTLVSPYLCEYVDIHRGKHDRVFVVSEIFDQSFSKMRPMEKKTEGRLNLSLLKQWAFQIVSGLEYLQQHGIFHTCLSPHNILLDAKQCIKLSGYGLFYMTGQGVDIDFPIGYPTYLAPECVLTLNDHGPWDKRDGWAVAVILIELYTRSSFWTTADVGLIFDSLTTLNEWEEESDESIWDHKDIASLDINKDVLEFLQGRTTVADTDEDRSFRDFALSLLQVSYKKRPSIRDILSMPFLLNANKGTTVWTCGPVLASDALDEMESGDEGDTRDMGNRKDTTNTVDEGTEFSQSTKDFLDGLPIVQIYHLWRLAGGDVELDLMKRGVFLSTPVIERLPRICTLEDVEIGSDTNDTAQLYSDTMYSLGFKELYQRLEQGRRTHTDRFEWDTDYFMVVDENDVNFLLDSEESEKRSTDPLSDNYFMYAEEASPSTPAQESLTSPSPLPTTPSASRSTNRTFSWSGMSRSGSASSLTVSSPTSLTPTVPTAPTAPTAPKLPLLLREQNVDYQYHRQTLFSELLRQYPTSHKEILHHAKIDIPPLLRGKVWAAVLGVTGDLEHEYDSIDKYTDLGADRQIEVDVPRCHQYNQLLASSVGHEKLRRLLKAWVSANRKLVYWQGLDSLCAPFLTLNFNDEAIAFACLQRFIPKFLNNFFLSDNAPVLQEYLAVFRHLLSYHDSALSSHLDTIGFNPELYAIPWFLTLFTHVFPLDKIYHLWDKLLVGPSSLPLFAGIAILRQIRDMLLTCEFNDCITLFSESFPKVDIEKCVQSAMSMCKITPPSVMRRVHGLKENGFGSPLDTQFNNLESQFSSRHLWWEDSLSIEARKSELAPRIDIQDLAKVLPYTLILDIRSDQAFSRVHFPSAMNVQAAQLDSFAGILRKLNRKHHIVIADRGPEGPEFAAQLVNKHFSRVALLQGGIDALKSMLMSLGDTSGTVNQGACLCRPQKQTTAGFKGKGSEPPFIIWRCKVPPPLIKK